MAEVAIPLVLVVDDYADTRWMYVQYLEADGFRAAEAADGFEAVRQAAALRPDIILMDISLPGLDGCEATRRLKAQPETADIPVIALSGRSETGLTERVGQTDCIAFLLKPVLPETVAQEVRRALRRTPEREGSA